VDSGEVPMIFIVYRNIQRTLFVYVFFAKVAIHHVLSLRKDTGGKKTIKNFYTSRLGYCLVNKLEINIDNIVIKPLVVIYAT